VVKLNTAVGCVSQFRVLSKFVLYTEWVKNGTMCYTP